MKLDRHAIATAAERLNGHIVTTPGRRPAETDGAADGTRVLNVVINGGEPALVIDFDDTRLLAPLFGAHDRHLARIEQRLGLSLVPRGNRVAILGEAYAADVARAALEDLYQRLI